MRTLHTLTLVLAGLGTWRARPPRPRKPAPWRWTPSR